MSLKVLKFGATWCPPCKMLAPVFKKISQDYSDVDFDVVDVDDDSDTASKYSVSSVPTMVFEVDGQEVDRLVGLVKEQVLRDKVEALK